jgi:two-component system response regulator FixJ
MTMPDKRIIHIVDDEEPVRRSIGFMLRANGFRVRPYLSGVEFLLAAGSVAPGCILLDIRMPDMDGLAVQQTLKERGITHPVIMLTGHGDVTLAVRAIKAGAINFLEKPFEKIALLDAIEEAFRHLENEDLTHLNLTEAAKRLAVLTMRERDVLEGLVRGQPNKITAFELGISTRTVEAHRANLMVKLQLHSLSDVLRLSFAAGLGASDPP